MSDPYFQLINRVLTEGKMSNSYKPALLRSMANYGSSGNTDLCVSWSSLAEQFVRYYWPLAVKHHIRQATVPGKEPVVIKLIQYLGVVSKVTVEQFVRRSPRRYRELIDRLSTPGSDCCLDEVVPRFHNLRGDPPALLYSTPSKQQIDLTQDSLNFLTKNHETLRLLSIGRWVKFTEKYSKAPRIYEKIEGRLKRGSVKPYRDALVTSGMAIQCFYCRNQLDSDWAIDHFLPWSFVLDDKLWNLVPSCRGCNSDKSDSIPVDHLDRLFEKNARL